MQRFRRMRRKILGLLFGVSLGTTVSLYSSKSHAFFGTPLTPEEIFEMFIERAGGVFMRFLGNRFMSNMDIAFDQYTEYFRKNKSDDNAIIGKMIATSEDLTLRAFSETNNHELKLNTYTPGNACHMSEQSSVNQNISKAADSVQKVAFQNQFNNLSHGTGPNSEKRNYRDEAVRSLADDYSTPVLKELNKLFFASTFADTERAEKELAALLGDFEFDIRTGGTNKATIRDEVLSQGSATKLSVIVNQLSMLLAQRVPTEKADDVIDTIGSSTLGSNYLGRKLSMIERLELEVKTQSQNEAFTEELKGVPSLAAGMILPNLQSALTHKLQFELHKVRDARALIESLSSLKR